MSQLGVILLDPEQESHTDGVESSQDEHYGSQEGTNNELILLESVASLKK